MNKKKGHRSQMKKGYYERQYAVTARNKARRRDRAKRRTVMGVTKRKLRDATPNGWDKVES